MRKTMINCGLFVLFVLMFSVSVQAGEFNLTQEAEIDLDARFETTIKNNADLIEKMGENVLAFMNSTEVAKYNVVSGGVELDLYIITMLQDVKLATQHQEPHL